MLAVMSKKIDKVAAVSLETTGASINSDISKQFQIISFGVSIASTKDFTPIESMYKEIRWNRSSTWSPELESVHGFTKPYLEENGIDEDIGAAYLADIFLNHFEDGPVVLLGHNICSFTLPHIQNLFYKYDIDIRFSSRMYDTFSVGNLLFNLNTSKEIFKSLKLDVNDLNALHKANAYLKLYKLSKVYLDKMR